MTPPLTRSCALSDGSVASPPPVQNFVFADTRFTAHMLPQIVPILHQLQTPIRLALMSKDKNVLLNANKASGREMFFAHTAGTHALDHFSGWVGKRLLCSPDLRRPAGTDLVAQAVRALAEVVGPALIDCVGARPPQHAKKARRVRVVDLLTASAVSTPQGRGSCRLARGTSSTRPSKQRCKRTHYDTPAPRAPALLLFSLVATTPEKQASRVSAAGPRHPLHIGRLLWAFRPRSHQGESPVPHFCEMTTGADEKLSSRAAARAELECMALQVPTGKKS